VQTITDDLRAILKAKFQAAADGFRARLEVETDVPFSGCSVGSMEFIADDLTNAATDGVPPKTTVISAPTENPSLLLAIGAFQRPGDALGWDLVVASPWTMFDGNLHTGDYSYNGWLSGIACLPYTGGVIPDVEFSWASNPAGGESIVTSVAIHTSATSDVQHASNTGAGSPVYLGSVPTEGNLLLMVSIGDGTPPPGDWVTVHVSASLARSESGVIGVWMRCVGAGESVEVEARGAWNYLSEWAVEATTVGFAPHVVTRVSIDKSMQTDADAFEVELDNADGSKSLYPSGDTYLPTKRCRIWQWYGDPANAVQVFDGFIDKVQEHRNPRTLTLTGRCWMKRLLVQDILVTDPQGADETGAVRTTANFVYLGMEVSDIVDDLLDEANYPTGAARSVQQTSYMVAEFLGSDGNSFADAVGQLADLVGYNSYADELGTYHFEANARAQATADTDTAEVPVWTFRAGEDIVVIDPEQDDYELKTRIRVTGPMSTTVLNDAFTELWHSAALRKPTGIWFDSADSGNIRVSDGATHKVYKVSQTTRAIVSASAALCSGYLAGLSGDPADATVYWILEAPWKTGSGTTASVHKIQKSDDSVLLSWNLPNEHWTDIKADASNLWLSNLTDDKVWKYTKAGASVTGYSISYGGAAQVNPTGLMVDGTDLWMFFMDINRVLKATVGTPGTITKAISTAGTQMVGGEVDTVTHTEFWSCSDVLGLIWKYTLVEPVTTERAVFAEVVDTALETALGEVRRLVVRMDAITSLAQATETAQRWLGQLDHTRQQLDVGIIGNPAIQKGDMIRIEDPMTGIASDWEVDTYRSEMSGQAGTYLGILSLLPWSSEYN
jgi:hypothetical protein